MRHARILLIVAFLTTPAAGAQQSKDARATAEIVRNVAEKQKTRPFWFVLNGTTLDRIPFVYQVSSTRTQFEPDGGAKTQSATSWCWAYISGRSTGNPCTSKLADLSNVERPRPGQTFDVADRFWDEFRKAFAFETHDRQNRLDRPTIVISFAPKPGYSSNRNDDTAIFPSIRGRIWIDETDLEIVRFEYEFFKDSTALVFGKVHAGTRYAMDLEKQLDGFWLPTLAATKLYLGVLNSNLREESTVRFSNYFK